MTLPILFACKREPAVTRALAQVRQAPDSETIAACARRIGEARETIQTVRARQQISS
mgnify:CR=1 FL=1